MARKISLAARCVSAPTVFGGPAYPVRDEDGEFATWDWFVGITVEGVDYQHPHAFRRNDKWGAEQFAARMVARGEIDLDHWTELPPQPTSEELAETAWLEELEDRRQWGIWS